MKMVIGGAWQGQLEWARKQYGVTNWIDGKNCPMEEIFTCEGIVDFHEYVKRMMEAEKEFDGFANKLISQNPNIVIVSNEIGYGLVPIDAFERAYREQTGRICTELATFAEQVVRVVMGIGTVIK